MKRLSDFKDEEALDVLCEIIEPACEIMADERVQKAFEKGSGFTVVQAVKLIIKEHKRAVMQVMAALECVPFEEYHCNLLTLPIQIMQIVNDNDLLTFFQSQVQTDSLTNSGLAMENTEEQDGSDIS